jgi:general secretion pathway protein K
MRPNNRGSALLTALFIMTLVAIVSTAMAVRLQLDIYRTRILIAHDKLYLASQAVMFWAFNELNNKENQFAQVNAQGMVSTYPSSMKGINKGLVLTGALYDLQGKLNLNNLTNVKAIGQYVNLFSALYPKMNDREKMSLGLTLKDWLSPYDLARGNDLYTSYYNAQKPPYYAAHQLMKSSSEFRLLKEVNASMNQIIQPYITALPETTPININTASKPILKLLGDGLTAAQLEELLQTRGKGMKNNKKLIPLLQKLNIPSTQVTIESQYFLSKAHAKNEDLDLVVYVLLKRSKDKKGIIKVSVIREGINGF